MEEKKKTSKRYSAEVRDRAVRLLGEALKDHASEWAAIESISSKIGCSGETLRGWFRQAERDSGERDGMTTEDRARMKALERENRELKQANEILRKASAYFAQVRPAGRSSTARSANDRLHRRTSWRARARRAAIEPICRQLQIAPSSYHARKAQQRDPEQRSDRAKRDDALCPEIERVWHDNLRVYGARKVWHQLRREGLDIARCTVSRLMKRLGLAGGVRGKSVKTTQSDKAAPCPLDRVNRKFKAPEPNRLWVSDFTYVRTWSGFVYTAFVIDVFARRIVGWKVSRSPTAEFVLHALEQALHERRPCECSDDLAHHSDRGVQYVSIKYGERLAGAGIAPSVGSVGDSYDNALAETIIGLYKTEPIGQRGPWRRFEDVEFATLEWVDWFNNRRLLGPIGNIPPAEAEANFYAQLAEIKIAA